MEISNLQVSKYSNRKSKISTEVSLTEELMNIKNGSYSIEINACRKELVNSNYEKYKQLKGELPGVTFSGVFLNARKIENLKKYNSILILDIDKIQKQHIEIFKEKIKNDDYTMALWLSPSAMGLKVLVKTKSEPFEHKSYFNSILDYYKSNYDINLDR